MSFRRTTCKFCRQKLTPERAGQVVHLYCAGDYAIALGEKKARAQAKAVKRADAADTKARKEKLKTRADWLKEAQRIANRYARVRDIREGRGCISCGEVYKGVYGGAFDGGHFRSTGSAPHLRLFLKNIHLQCVKCNRYLSSNSVEYRRNLIARIGSQAVDALESDQEPRRMDADYLARYKSVIGKRLRRMEKRM